VPGLYQRYPPAERSIGEANPFTLGGAFVYNAEKGRKRWDALNDLLGAIAVDAHPELSDAWQAVVEHLPGTIVWERGEKMLFTPPCSEAELDQYAKDITTKPPSYRAETINRWGEEARQGYRRVMREARWR
jgi:hypothetical protein